MDVNRRSFLRGSLAAGAGTALAAALTVGGARADAAPAVGTSDGEAAAPASYPFHGTHQAGVLTPGPADKQRAAAFVALDVTAATRSDLTAVFQTLTDRARALTGGGRAPDLGIGQPPADSDVLGPDIPADGLTVTVSVGASLFDDRYGLSSAKPDLLTPMRVFPDDALEDVWTGGDVMLQLCAHNPDTVHHALRDVTKHTRGGLQPRWRMDGFGAPPRPSGSSRNLLGFKDGTANPTGTDAADLVWIDDPAQPAWVQGGSYQVVRVIRMLTEFWDRVSLDEQQNMMGRRRDTGAPLDGSAEFDTPDYAADPRGDVIPLNAHMRMANPRTPQTDDQRLLRRSYNYDRGLDTNGNLDVGHIFTCYQQDVQRQFESVQLRLVGEPLVDYVQPFGGGYFLTLPGVRDAGDHYAKALLT